MISKIVRRTHMYLGLVLVPWVLMYAFSTMAMNHRESFKRYYGGTVVSYEKEQERKYSRSIPPNAQPQSMAEDILKDLQLEGSFTVRRAGNGFLSIQRLDPITPRRITYRPGDSTLVVEKETFRVLPFLERMHRRRGYQHPYLLEDAWALSVDIVIAAMVFWVISGLWLWWELSVTRRLGALFLIGGIALFVFFVFTI